MNATPRAPSFASCFRSVSWLPQRDSDSRVSVSSLFTCHSTQLDADSGLRPECANTRGSPAARRTGQVDPLLPFKVGPMNGREARQSGLRLKAVDRTRSVRARRTFRRQESWRAAERQPRGRRLVDRDLAALLLSASRLCVSPWRGALGSAPTDFRATLVAGASLVSDRVRIGRRSRRPRPVARHGLDHKPP